ncbi:MAG: tRNA pseudouridine(13) synthase TruD [Nitrososphaerales archaeon]
MIPSLDSLIGITNFCTSFEGIGGKIRENLEDFVVEEVLWEDLEFSREPSNYMVFKLRKRGIDTLHAIKKGSKMIKGRLYFLGMKDARALTTQYVYTENKRQIKYNFSNLLFTLEFFGYTERPLRKEDLKGNFFHVSIKDFNAKIDEAFDKINLALKEKRLLNFFGYQRFGSKRPISHLIGREMVKRNFKEALNLLLCYSYPYEDLKTREIREICSKGDYERALKDMNSKMDLEMMVIKKLLKGSSPIDIFRTFPLKLRRLFVQAYQSYLFNLTLSEALEKKLNFQNFEEGELVLSLNKRFSKPFPYKDGIKNNVLLPLMPLIGYSYRSRNTKFDELISKVMNREGIRERDFFIDELQEASVPGDFRIPILLGEDFKYYLLEDKLQLSFFLYRGSYATMLLRELMKPSDPYLAGF